MIFTFGAACKKAEKLRNELNSKIGNLKAEMSAAQKLDKRFHYFDQLKKLAGTLTEEASGLLDVTKELQSKMQGTYNELVQDFTDEEIDDQLGDVDFANDFAEQLMEALDRLKVQCDITIKDTKERKERLTHALIWGNFGVEEGKEELMQLSADGSDEAALMAHFYEDLASGCNKFYGGASAKFEQDIRDLSDTIVQLGKHKHLIMNYSQAEFHDVKGSIFNIVDSLIDSQREIDSVETYNIGKIKYLKKRIDAEPWKFQLKYSSMITKYCGSNNARIMKFEETIAENSAAITVAMTQVSNEFIQKANKDLQAWDC